jgi:pheromone shutdown-related protein TraB
MITLIGTGHVFNLSSAILDVFEKKQPEIVCVELDTQRSQALMLKKNNPEGYKKVERNVPVLYKILARFQENMAKEYGVTAGEEMITAIEYAQTHQLPVAFIDMNAQKLFSRMLKSMSFSEKFKLVLSGFGGFFVSKKRVEKELSNIEEDFDKYIEEIGKKLPTIKRVLIDERNMYMVQKLISANEQYEKVIAVLGDGHIPGISKLLKDKEIDFDVVRLHELRNHKPDVTDSSTASFSTQYKELFLL